MAIGGEGQGDDSVLATAQNDFGVGGSSIIQEAERRLGRHCHVLPERVEICDEDTATAPDVSERREQVDHLARSVTVLQLQRTQSVAIRRALHMSRRGQRLEAQTLNEMGIGQK